MEYFGLGINQSATISMEAAADIENARFLAVKFDEDGKAAVCGSGENAIGLLLVENDEKVLKGSAITVQVKDMGRWIASTEIKAGDELTSDAEGKAVVAESGNFITAIALCGATNAGDVIQVQIVKAGYKA